MDVGLLFSWVFTPGNLENFQVIDFDSLHLGVSFEATSLTCLRPTTAECDLLGATSNCTTGMLAEDPRRNFAVSTASEQHVRVLRGP